ncbi:YqaJ viral recombinase family protein [Streptomyces sp. PRKS01-29]|nr:YqaJ viral recombinase family protein [Streptomyces sabulosicollis]MBI0296748.1 YqaJ viral recombinase family protein [Streptomyces sabulosicollis]
MTAPTMPTTAELIGHFQPGSPEWHAARANGIGGSEIAAVLGLSPYESRFSLWHRKKNLVEPAEQSDVMEWGHRLEDAIVGKYAEEHPEQTVVPAATYHAPGRPWWIVNPDRLAINPDGSIDVVEAKNQRMDDEWGEPGTDQVPIWYRCQVAWYCGALAARRGRLPVLIGGSEYREYVVEPTAAEIETLAEAGAEFMRTLADNERPDIDGHSATYQVVKALPEGLEDVDVPVTEADRDRYFAALAAFTEAETEKRAAAAVLLDQIGNGRRATYDRKTVATRTVRNGKTYSLQPARNRSTAA